MRLPVSLAALLVLAACAQEAAEEPAAAPESGQTEEAAPEADPVYTYDGWIGVWTGVEGMFVDIQPDGAGGWVLEMQSDLDTTATYAGVSTAEGIAFERDGQTLVLREGDGAATGLKWLDGKENCLVVAEGEGYCRD